MDTVISQAYKTLNTTTQDIITSLQAIPFEPDLAHVILI